MPDKILHKRSYTLNSKPTTSNLDPGELAINVNDGKAFLRKSGSGSDTIEEFITTNTVNTGSITISGSATITGSLRITGSINATSITSSFTGSLTGSLLGTASWAQSASHVVNAFIQGGNSFGTTALLGTNDIQDLSFETNGSTRVTISGSTGFVGIGTTTPASRLDVQGTIFTGNASATEGSILLQDQYNLGHATTIGTNRSSGGPVIGYAVYPSSVNQNQFSSSVNNTQPWERSAFSMDGSFRWYTGGAQTLATGASASLSQKMILTNAGNLEVIGNISSSAVTASNILVIGTLTAQTIVAQTITSSTDFITGSTRFGTLVNSNTHQFTGSVGITGSLTVIGRTIASGSFTGSFLGNYSGSYTGSFTGSLTGSLLGTSSWARNALTASSADEFTIRADNFEFTGSISTTGSITLTGRLNATSITSSFTGSLTGSLLGTASWAQSASQALTASFISSTGGTNAFIQGGNSFGTTALLGTNDNFPLGIETGGSTRLFISGSRFIPATTYSIEYIGFTTSSGTSITLPSGLKQYDLVVVTSYLNNTASIFPRPSGSIGAGVAEDATRPYTLGQSGSINSVKSMWYYRVMGSSLDTSIVNITGSTIAFAFRNVDTTNPIHVIAPSASGATGFPNPPSLTTTNSGSVVVAIGYLDDDQIAPTNITASVGYTLIGSTSGSVISNTGSIMAEYLIKTTPGLEDPGLFRTGSGTPNDSWVANTFALNRYTSSAYFVGGDIQANGGLLASHASINPAQRYPIGHHSAGETVFEIDPTWTETQLQSYFNSSNVTWATSGSYTGLADAPGGYAIKISGSINVGYAYGSGLPIIPVDTASNDWYYMECWIKNEIGQNAIHYLGSVDINENFQAITPGNGGTYTYNAAAAYDPGTSWVKTFGYWNGYGFTSGTGGTTGNTVNFPPGTKYFSPLGLFNYAPANNSASSSYISGWKVIKVSYNGTRYFQDNVGIGGINPSTRLNVKEANTGTEGFIVTNWNGVNTSKIGSDSATGGGKLSLITNGNVTTVFLNSYTSSYFNGGNIGIGTTSPTYKLSISGSNNSGIFLKQGSQIGDTVTSANFYSGLTFENVSTTNAWSIGYSQGAAFGINYFDGTSTYSRFLTLTNAGRVGIGTITPDAPLRVVGTTNSTHSIFSNVDGRGLAIQTSLVAGTNDAGSILNARGATAGTLIIQTDGTERVRVASTGNVGIDNTNPQAKFVVSNAGTQSLEMGWSSGLNANYIESYNRGPSAGAEDLALYTAGNKSIRFYTNTTEKVVISGSGNVGIGLTSPSAKLHISGTTGAVLEVDGPPSLTALYVSASGDIGVGTATPYTYPGYRFLSVAGTTGAGIILYSGSAPANSVSLYAYNGGGDFQVNNGTLNIYTGTAGTASMVINTSRNVGIGTTSPAVRLEISGSNQELLRLRSAAKGNWIGFTSGSTNLGYVGYGSTSNNTLTFMNYQNEGVFIGTNSTTIMTVTGSNVGIGHTTPSATLSVSKAASNFIFDLENQTETGFKLRTYNSGSTGTGTKVFTQYLDYAGSTNGYIAFHRGGGGTDGYLSFGDNGGERVRINNIGNVGIGTTLPTSRLHVSGAVNSSWLTIIDNVGTTDAHGLLVNIGASSTGVPFGVYKNASSPLLYVSNAGNVGIGTTNLPAKLTVAGNGVGLALIGDLYGSGNYTGISLNGTSSATTYNFLSGITDQNLYINRPADKDMYFRAGNANQVIIDSAGDVGIGTTSPSYKLDIAGTIGFTVASVSTPFATKTSHYNVLYEPAGNIAIYLGSGSGTGGDPGNYYDNTNHFFRPRGGGATVFTQINSNGLGIGVSPSYKLDVSGGGAAARLTSNTTYTDLAFTNTSATSYIQASTTNMHFYVAGGSSGDIVLTLDGTNNRAGIITTSPSYPLDVTGVIRATSDIIAYSDARVKENIVLITGSLDIVKKLRGVTYTRKDIEDKSQKVGVIAQEVLEVLPQVVQQDENGHYSVAYGNIVGVLIEAIKEQQKQIDELKYLLQNK